MNTAAATIPQQARALAEKARAASRILALASTAQKDSALDKAAELLLKNQPELEAANARDLDAGRENGLAEAKLDRLRLDGPVLTRLAEGLRQTIALPDPVGEVISRTTRPNGLDIQRVRTPLGVILMIFESRPNVTIEAGSLCLKSGNAIILRGGSEARHSNAALAGILREGLKAAGLPEDAVAIPPSQDRAFVSELLQLEGLIDVAIPRGGEGLIRAVAEQSKIPVLKHYKGICHVYVDSAADRVMAEKIVINSKLQRVSVCNAAETLLVHASLAEDWLPKVGHELVARGCELVAEPTAHAVLERAGLARLSKAQADAFDTEYLDKVLSVKVVASIQEAMDHIERHGSRHTDCIVTEDAQAARLFQQQVNSASVFVNCSTRFADGFQYGLGAEIGISTEVLHARGPMGLESLTTYKWLANGAGQILEKS
jgi:glutamate-5-semialdehyde dehydrogenase